MKNFFKIVTLLLLITTAFYSIHTSAFALVDVKKYKLKTLTELNTYEEFPYYHSYISSISEFADQKGNYYVAYDGEKYFYIAKLKKSNMKLQKTIKIKKPYPMLGGVIMDKNGYFYALFGQNDKAGKGKTVTVSVVQYNGKGKKVKELAIKGKNTDVEGDLYWGTRYPFHAGNASMAISGDILAITYAREMYNGHQSNHVIYVKIPSLVRNKKIPEPYTSHSFDQRVIVTSDNGFLFADQGDAFPRGFHIQKVMNNRLSSFEPFHFREGYNIPYGYNNTFAFLGGIAEVSTGYVLAGSSEKTLSLAPKSNKDEAENVFVQIFKKDFDKYSDKQKQIINASVRKATGKPPKNAKTELFLDKGTKDYGVKWITNYKKDEFASNVKVVGTKNDQIVILWEKMKNSKGYVATYYAILNNKGKTIKGPTKLKNVRLTGAEQPVYDGKYIYWSSGEGKTNIIYRLKVFQLSVSSVDSSMTEVKGKTDAKAKVKLTIGKKVKTTKADSEGNFQFKISKQRSGTKIKLTVTDSAKNSTTKTITVKPKLSIDTLSDKSTKITGIAESAATVKVYVNNKLIKKVKANKNGKYSVAIKKQKAGTKVKAVATKNKLSKTMTTTVIDKTSPTMPTVSAVNSTTTKISGKAEKGSVVYVYIGNKLIGKATSNKNGVYTINISAQEKDTKIVVYAQDKAGNKSGSVGIIVQ